MAAKKDDGGSAPADVSAPEAAAAAKKAIGELTSKESLGVAMVEPTEHGWLVGVEVLENQRIPASSDVLALYEVEISLDGDLLNYRRTRRYLRSSTNDEPRTSG